MDFSPASDSANLLLKLRNYFAPEGTAKLRVGLVSVENSIDFPVEETLAFLKVIPGIEVSRFSICSRLFSKRPKSSPLLDQLRSLSKRKHPQFTSGENHPAAQTLLNSLDTIANAGCDLLLWLAPPLPSCDVSSWTKFGIFTVGFGSSDSIPFWNEVSSNTLLTSANVYWHAQSFESAALIRHADLPSYHGLYFTLNSVAPLQAAARMLANLCFEFAKRRSDYLDQLSKSKSLVQLSSTPPIPPDSLAVLRFVASKLTRSYRLSVQSRSTTTRWGIAWRAASSTFPWLKSLGDFSGFHQIPFPEGIAELADPFCWSHQNQSYILAEVIRSGSSKGELASMRLGPDGKCSDFQIILEQPTHLSFPCIVPVQNELFMIPESSAAHSLDLYRFASFPHRPELATRLIEGLELVDSTPLLLNGVWYLFTSTIEPFVESWLLTAPSIEGPWSVHPASPISSSIRNSRSAGNLVWDGDRLFRFTQDSGAGYGYGIQVNEVTRLTPTEFEEHSVNYLGPDWTDNILGTHTWNATAEIEVIDAKY